MNIAELVSRTQPGDGDSAQLFIQITAHSPATQNAANIEQAFKALCTELNAQGSINIVNYSQHDKRKLITEHGQPAVFDITTAAADVASDRIHDAGTVSPQGGNNQIVL